MKLVIIVTTIGPGEAYRLWESARNSWQLQTWQHGELECEFLEKCVDNDRKAIMVSERICSQEAIEAFIEQHANQLQITDELFIAAHYHGVFQRRSIQQLAQRPQIYVKSLRHQRNDQPYEAIRAFIDTPTQQTFDDMCREIKKKLNERLSILKHRIAHLFLPIDIDLQGLMETGFREDYWEEVAEAWKGGKALGTLTEARKLVYGSQGVKDSVQKVVEDAKSSACEEHKNKIDCAWKKVQALLPNANDQGVAEELQSLRRKYEEAKQILQGLGNGDKNAVEQKCRNRTNPFHQWFVQLIEALDELRDAIERAQGGESGR